MLRPVICQGRRISLEELEWLRGWIVTHGDWSRKRLARELCVLWDWRNGVGRLKVPLFGMARSGAKHRVSGPR